MPTVTQDLPGALGSDYEFVRYGNRTYVVYKVKLPNGSIIKVSWRIDPKDFERFGVKDGKVRGISKAEFERIENFGNAGEVQFIEGEHPFQTYIRQMRQQYGNVSWLNDREFMQVFLMGYAEGLSPTALENYLRQTKWYQSRTDRQRQWELEIGKADRRAQIKGVRTQVSQILSDLYGPDVDLVGLGFTDEKLAKVAEKIASGFWGDPSDGLMIWAEQQRRKAAKAEGTPAWIDEQQQIEEQRAFLNRPEEIRGQLREQAQAWLGPSGVPDFDTLTKWAQDLASGKASEEDWTNFLQTRAKSLYPWLSTGESWQDAASPYKAIAENLLGQSVGWDNTLLRNIGGLDANGQSTGQLMTYSEWERYIRSQDAFYKGPTARTEGWNLFATLDQAFNGRTY